MILTKNCIEVAREQGGINITPWRPEQLNPNSYDLRLGTTVLCYTDDILDAALPLNFESYEISDKGILLQPDELYLMATEEVTESRDYVPGIEGRSSIGRLGVSIHATAGFGDVGFSGTWTLEVSCIRPVRVYAGMRICQIFFEDCSAHTQLNPCLYNGKYNGQSKPRESRIYQEQHEWLRG